MLQSVPEENVLFVTKTCYIIDKQYNCTLINGDKKMDDIPERSWQLLNRLMQQKEQLVSREDLIEAIWGKYADQGFSNLNTVKSFLKKSFLQIGLTKDEYAGIFQTVDGKGMILHTYHPDTDDFDVVIKKLHKTGLPVGDLVEIIECMLYRGISGRMGREGVIALAKKNNTLAALEVGELYYHGYITRNHRADFKAACEYYEKAGDHPTALWTLGYCIMNNYWPVVEKSQIDYRKARDYFARALEITTTSATGISAAAYTSLGQLWEEGHYPADNFETTHICLPRDMKKAVELYSKANDLGYHYATNRLGRYYEQLARTKLEKREENRQRAFQLFSRSVELVVDGYALNKLGNYYEEGFGCEKNPSKACDCYMRGVSNEVLEDDVTGWNLFNAARVCAYRIKGQPELYYDLSRAFDLFEEALRKLPQKDHGKVLLEMVDILLHDDVSAFSPETVKRKRREASVWVERFLSAKGIGSQLDGEIVDKLLQFVELL